MPSRSILPHWPRRLLASAASSGPRLRPSTASASTRSSCGCRQVPSVLTGNVYCPPVYRSDFVLGGLAGADVWMNLSERLLVQSSGRAVVDWYREFSDQRSVAPDVSQAVRYVGPRFHLDFGWRHVESRRGMLSEVAQRVRRAAFDRRVTTAVRLGRFALEAEWGDQRVRYRSPRVAHQSLRYDWFNADIGRTRAVFRPAVAGPSRWSVTVERLGHRSVSRPLRQRRLDATTVMLETELLTGLRLEGRVGIGWTRERRPDYHRQLGVSSAALSAPVWRIDLSLPSEAADLDLQLRRRFTQSVLPGPPALDDFREAPRPGQVCNAARTNLDGISGPVRSPHRVRAASVRTAAVLAFMGLVR